jgi:tripartite-type tricarboxylate transporter receptor subunit TctC
MRLLKLNPVIPLTTPRHPAWYLALAAFVWHYTAAATAQTCPARPVRYIVPFPAAASPDIIPRLLTERLSRLWNQQVVVDNRSGAGGTLGAAYAAKAPADGYTLFQCNILQRFNELVVVSAPTSRDEFTRFIAAETARWARVIKQAGISQQ